MNNASEKREKDSTGQNFSSTPDKLTPSLTQPSVFSLPLMQPGARGDHLDLLVGREEREGREGRRRDGRKRRMRGRGGGEIEILPEIERI